MNHSPKTNLTVCRYYFRSATCAFIFMYGYLNTTTNSDIDLMLEITEAFTFRILVTLDGDIIRPINDKVPVIAHLGFNDKVFLSKFYYPSDINKLQVKYLCGNHTLTMPLHLMMDPWVVCEVSLEDQKEIYIYRGFDQKMILYLTLTATK